MAEPNISLLGATYSGVKGVTLPKSGGGTATFPWVEGSETKTANGTYDVTNLAQLIVNVSGGGSSPWHKLVNAQENTVSTTSTSSSSAFTIELGSAAVTKNQIIWVHIRDKAGKRAGYFFGSDVFFINYNKANGSTTTTNIMAGIAIRYTNSSLFAATSGGYGVFGYSLTNTGKLQVNRRYNSSNSLTVNGTYVTNVYALDLPDSLTLF